MQKDYHYMWADLGLNLKAHDELLGVLSQAYQNTYLSQKRSTRGDFASEEMEKLTRVSITAQLLKEAIGMVNTKRTAVHHLSSLKRADPAPVSGPDALLVKQNS